MALVLSRKRGEAVYIGPDTCVRIAEVRGGKVRLSITSPKAVEIMRGELLAPGDPRHEIGRKAVGR